MVKIGLLGLGNVGTGVLSILRANQSLLQNRLGKSLEITKILVKDAHKKRPDFVDPNILTTSVQDILQDPTIDIIVEVMGNEYPAYDYIKQALQNKKYVVTANKEVIAKHKAEFFKIAQKNKVDILYEASVGGGIPVIHSITVGYAANEINSIYGILNGTTNYILTKMEQESLDFDSALKQAQALGFAEADPNFDINGLDVAFKLNILAAIAFNVDISLDKIAYSGINTISLKDIHYAKEFGYRIKLLAIARKTDKGLIFKVHPTMIPISHPLSAVNDEFNAICVEGNAIGQGMIYGKGAGSQPTGSAVIADIMDIAFNSQSLARRNYQMLLNSTSLLHITKTYSKFYIRFIVQDRYGVLEKIAKVFGKNKISLLKVYQNELKDNLSELVVVTHTVLEKNMALALEILKKADPVVEISSMIRVELDDID